MEIIRKILSFSNNDTTKEFIEYLHLLKFLQKIEEEKIKK